MGTGRHTSSASRQLQPRWHQRLVAALAERRLGGRRVRSARRVVAILLMVVAAGLAVIPAGPPPSGNPVVMVARDLPVGATVTDSDVQLVQREQLPDGAITELRAAVGSTITAATRRGELLTDARLGRAGPNPGPGRSAIPVALDRVDIGLFQPGMHVVVLAVDEAGNARKVAADAIVLLAGAASADQSGKIGETAGSGPATVLLSVPEADADTLAAAALTRDLAIRFQ